jgi:hypothetical protein
MEVVRQHKGKIYLMIFILSAFFLVFIVNTKMKTTIIEAGCSDVASRSSSLLNRGVEGFDDIYSYENLKSKCLQEASSN